MQLFYYPDLSETEITLNKEESKHVVKVLRKNVGDILHFTDGKGTLAKAEIIDINPKACTLGNLQLSTEQLPTPQLTIACAPTKSNDRFEWFLEKSTEVGIRKVVALICERSERRVVKENRLQKVLVAAMKQSLRNWLPQLEVTTFSELVKQPFEGQKFIAHCMETDRKPLQNILKPGEDALILIGPEGDFSETEISLALENGFEPITLGSSRLRTETAAITSCIIFNTANQ